jgi:hypothetical protein
VRRRGWEPAFVGWLIDADQPLTSARIAKRTGWQPAPACRS